MATYYLEYKGKSRERLIHHADCNEIRNKMDYLLLGDFSSKEHLLSYAQWHFPDWNIALCSCC
ncbi:hypothetical protein [Carboxylicivirga sp. M1479]|uniref:hypothetical protein n=1 Tax=Carboxylicivirga sp. M1479 TaxID=2594476 RepID=UPI00117893C4|nr:hypothetical protein [Carboxylicivirga sp. M1479]TRX71424.1 hypothetical protein FNN09_06555 [Carboxylicivirga sp. M1479]